MMSYFSLYKSIDVPLCVSGSKGKAGIQLKYIPEKRDTFEMYPRKVMSFDPKVLLFQPTIQCHSHL